MDSADHEPDPFSSESLWRLSRFSIEALQPLEDLPWNADLPSTYPAFDDTIVCSWLMTSSLVYSDSKVKLPNTIRTHRLT